MAMPEWKEQGPLAGLRKRLRGSANIPGGVPKRASDLSSEPAASEFRRLIQNALPGSRAWRGLFLRHSRL